MNYGLIYTIPFATLENIPCVVEIEKEGYSGNVTELTPASSPFTVDIGDEEFLYTPTRFSTAVIRIVGSDYLQSLFSTAYQQYRVTFKRNGVVTWCGFIKPELYTQDYTSTVFELELECMSGMSTLEFIDYKQIGENRVFVSLWDLLKECIKSSNSRYTAIYLPHVYANNAEEYNAGKNVLESMTISEQDFFDEDDKPMKLNEVLEEICKFLNWTCVDWKGELYFVDTDHIGKFFKYNPGSFEFAGSISLNLLDIQKVGFAGSDHVLDILSGYNKVTVKDSNYPVGYIFKQEDFDDMEKLVTPDDIRDGNEVCHRMFMLPKHWDARQYTFHNARLTPVNDLSSYKDNIEVNNLIGAVPLRYCNYEIRDNAPSITDYSYTDVIQVRQRTSGKYSAFGAKDPIIVIKGPTAVYSYGALCISGSFKIVSTDSGMSPLKKDTNYMRETDSFKFSVRIGDKYYDGATWKTDSSSRVRIPCSSDGESSDYRSFKNTKTLFMPYTGLNGFIIPIDTPIAGEVEVIFYGPNLSGNYPDGNVPYGFFLKDFKIEYQKTDESTKDDDNSDRIYENVINDNYINELDEIEFKISSYNNDGACYSKVMLGESYLTDNLYSAIESTTIRPEEQLIRRIIKRYSAPCIKLTQVIKAIPDLTPISRLYDNYMVNKRFINAGGTIDYKMNQFQCIMIEV